MEAAETGERLRRVLAARHAGLDLVLENVRKENVALVARTAEALGVGRLHLVYTADMVTNAPRPRACNPIRSALQP